MSEVLNCSEVQQINEVYKIASRLARWNPLRSPNFRLGLIVMGAVELAQQTYAQITNTPAGVSTIINAGVAPAYDTALSLGIAVVGIGFVVYFIKKGFKARS